MNYFGHAAMASFRQGSAPFVLGSMLPDLCSMAGMQVPEVSDGDLSDGLRYHLEVDSIFHQTEMFLHHNRRVLAKLRASGVGRGPARAAAHIGVEMLIDAELIERADCLTSYLEGLRFGAHELSRQITPGWGMFARLKMSGLCKHLMQHQKEVHAATEERFYTRFENALAGRRLLEPTTSELRIIAETLATDTEVSADVVSLLVEMGHPNP